MTDGAIKDIEIDILIRKNEALKDEVSVLNAEIELLRKKLSLAEDCLDKISDALDRGYSNDYTVTFKQRIFQHCK